MMEFLKKNWMKLVITLFALTTAFNWGNDMLSHQWQMYILSGLVLYHIWLMK